MFHLRYIFILIFFISSSFGLNFGYHKYNDMVTFLKNFTAKNSQLAKLYSIGNSVQGRKLYVVELSAAQKDEIGIPNVKLIGNIHGNEAVGRELLLHFLEFMVDSYSKNSTISGFLNTTRLHILPSLNPDGFEKASIGICDRGAGRNNANDQDLNRSFPDFFRNNSKKIQPETRAIQWWMNETQFVLSASLHGGALVANYPFENYKENVATALVSPPSISPDDDVFQYLATTYANTHPTMHLGQYCAGVDKHFEGGITNGAAWYAVTGGMQDYNYAFHGCMEITLEISCCKYPAESELPKLWDQNQMALLNFIMSVHRGIKGQVIDGLTKKPISKAILKIIGREMSFTTTKKGEFWRILLPNSYILEVAAEGYASKNTSFVHLLPKKNTIPQMKFLTIELFPLKYVTRATPTSTTDGSTSREPQLHMVEMVQAVIGDSANNIRNSLCWVVVSLIVLNLI